MGVQTWVRRENGVGRGRYSNDDSSEDFNRDVTDSGYRSLFVDPILITLDSFGYFG